MTLKDILSSLSCNSCHRSERNVFGNADKSERCVVDVLLLQGLVCSISRCEFAGY